MVFNYIFQTCLYSVPLGRIVVIYLDDILIFSRTWNAHMQQVRQVLQILRDNKLQVKEKKSDFTQSSVPYLGFVVNSEGIQPDPNRIKELKQWPLPCSVSELKKFIGGINFYHKFILHFSQIARPLHQLSNSTSTFNWTNDATSHFTQLKEAPCSSPVLHLPDPSQPFEIESDAS